MSLEQFTLARTVTMDRIVPDRLIGRSIVFPPAIYATLGAVYGGTLEATAIPLAHYLGVRTSNDDLALAYCLTRDAGAQMEITLQTPGYLVPLYREIVQPYWCLKEGQSSNSQILRCSVSYQTLWRYQMQSNGQIMHATSPCLHYQVQEEWGLLQILELYTVHDNIRAGFVWREDHPAPRPERSLLRELTNNLRPSLLQYTIPHTTISESYDLTDDLLAEGVEIDQWAAMLNGHRVLHKILINATLELSPSGVHKPKDLGDQTCDQLEVTSACTFYLREQINDLLLCAAHLE